MRIRLTKCLLLALALPTSLAAQPIQPPDRAETVAGWRISSGGSGDGGYEARLERRGRGWSFSHLIEYWRGNGGVSVHDEFRGNCRYGTGEDGILPYWTATSRARLDRQLTTYMRECPLPRAEAAALRASLARAWPHFLRHVIRQRAALDAEFRWMERGSPAR